MQNQSGGGSAGWRRCRRHSAGWLAKLRRRLAERGDAVLKPLHYYCVATGSWFFAHGVQNVLFAWLVAMVLRESPQMVGVAQMVLLLPAMLLMLLAGGIADVAGGRRVAMIAQGASVLPALGLLAVLAFDRLDFSLLLVYAVAMGCATAFVTPSRDGLLNQVAEGRVQRAVVLASLIQFGVQMIGFAVAGLAGWMGPEAVMALQATVLALGVVAYGRLPERASAQRPPVRTARLAGLFGSVAEGCATVLRSPVMRPVVIQNLAMAMFFMGSYIVTVPLLIREVYDGSSAELAMVNVANALGLVTSIMTLLLLGDVRRQGRALLFAHAFGCLFLAAAGLPFGFWAVVACLYCWGACGGVAMTMSRTIMQEAAPDGQRARVMGFFSFSFMGAGPVGAVTCGYLITWLGAPTALMVASGALLVVVALVASTSSLWNFKAHQPDAAQARESLAGGARFEPPSPAAGGGEAQARRP